MRLPVLLALSFTMALAAPAAHPAAQQPPKPPSFHAGADVVSVDVIVRDKSGAVVTGLKPEDFEIREDGRVQAISAFSFQQVTGKAPAAIQTADLLAAAQAKLTAETTRTAAAPPAQPAPVPLTSQMFAGRRLIVLLFDVSSMEPEDVQRAVDSANK